MCSTAKVGLVRSLGADHVIDYTRDEFVDGQHRYDVILDVGGNRRLSHLRRALTRHGTLVIVGGDLIESAGITPAIDHVYLLSEVPAAIQHVGDGRAKGKVVITL